MRTRAVATAICGLASVLAGVVTNLITDEWSTVWLVALVVFTVIVVSTQVWLNITDAHDEQSLEEESSQVIQLNEHGVNLNNSGSIDDVTIR